jgi:hypothetical protein
MAKIYQNLGIGDEKRLREGSVGYTFKINSASILPHAYEGEDTLGLQMSTKFETTSCGYGLIGKVKDEFMTDMKVGKVEELVGKEVVGFMHKDEPVLQGLAIPNKDGRVW